jgi:hypothetical protein
MVTIRDYNRILKLVFFPLDGCFVPTSDIADWRARLNRSKPPKDFHAHLTRLSAARGGTEVNLDTGRAVNRSRYACFLLC